MISTPQPKIDDPEKARPGSADPAAAGLVPVYAPWWQLLLASLYDLLAITGLLFVAAAPWAMLSDGDAVPAGSLLFQLYLLTLINLYFCFSWWRGGHTLGMRPWRIQIRRPDGALPAFGQCQLRFWVAIASWAAAGLGIIWQVAGRGSWHDMASGTRAVKVAISSRKPGKGRSASAA